MKLSQNFLFALLFVLISIVVLSIISYPKNQPQTSKISVVVSFYPLAEFAMQVGGDLIEVTNLTPAGLEPHDFEPTTQDLVKINQADIFIFNGNGLDAWAEKLHHELEEKGIVTLEMSEVVNNQSTDSSWKNWFKVYAHETIDTETSADPHFWLDPVIAQQMVKLISQKLIEIDLTNKAIYQTNTDNYVKSLIDLDNLFKTGLAECQSNEIIVSHDAFNYLARRYNLLTHEISGISPEEEPSPGKLADLAKLAKEDNIKYIFFESLVSPKLAQTLAQEVGAETLVLNPLEGLTSEETKMGQNYISVMQSNLTNLKTALECK